MDYEQLKSDIAEIIKTNGNEEITGAVLQYILLEMVGSLGKEFQFAGKGTQATSVDNPDEKMAWILGSGTYENFGDTFTVDENEFAIVMYDGTFDVKKVAVGRPVDSQLDAGSPNPIANDAVCQEFLKLRGAGYLFFGLALPDAEPPQELTERIFYLAAKGGNYQNFGHMIIPDGISVLKWNGSNWSVDVLWRVDGEPTDGSENLVFSGGVKEALETKVNKVDGKGLSEADYTNAEKTKLMALPTVEQLIQLLSGKQDSLTFDNVPTENSENPVTSAGIHEAIKNFITKAVSDLENYYTKSQTYTKSEVDTLVANSLVNYFTKSETYSKTEVDDLIANIENALQNYSTTEQMGAAITEALTNYYTYTEIDSIIAALKGQLCDVSLSADKSVILTNTSSQITLIARCVASAESITIERGGVTVGSGSGTLLSVSDVLNVAESSDVTYTMTAVIGGQTRTKEVTVAVRDAVLYGAGAEVTDITAKASARLTPAGRYNITAEIGDNLFILVPMGMTVNGVTMSGLEIPMEIPTGVFVNDVQYLCYMSSNVYDAGSYVINVY